MTIKIEKQITQQHFESIIVGALEGGSNYWYDLKPDEFRSQLSESTDGEPISMRIAEALYNNPEFKMNVYDVEDEGELLGTVTQESMLDGLVIAALDYDWHFNNLMVENDDAETADVMFQLATMKDIVFG
jgi:hypothetical protein